MKNQATPIASNANSEILEDSLVYEIVTRFGLTYGDLARYLGTSLVSVVRWAKGGVRPSSSVRLKLIEILKHLEKGEVLEVDKAISSHVFASRRAHRRPKSKQGEKVELMDTPKSSILGGLRTGNFWGDSPALLAGILADHVGPASTANNPVAEGVSAGKNTYTYDAHTYHTKVPPQGIAAVISRYLPEGGIVLDPFAGSGMTGVAALTLGADVILNELSPAASFIADRFTSRCNPSVFMSAVNSVCNALNNIRKELYTTHCRECGRETEILYTVWSYRVRCNACEHEFLLWDHCRRYGKTVREHKILKEFECPHCKTLLKKSRLARTTTEPVMLGYKCCSRYQVEHSLTDADRARIQLIETTRPLAAGFYPTTELPDGVNLAQPKRHNLTSVDRFYTARNLSAMSHIWREIHCLKDDEIAGFLAFVFTSLYQRVTKLSEFRFWGGSGNTANFNVPYIFNEANVFVTFERKARSILDHLETTAQAYTGRCIVRTGSATDMNFLPDNSIDLVFTDPPFGANINYSEMNILWESWFGAFTDTRDEAIVNRAQKKDVAKYGALMTASFKECYRVLRPGHWMIVVFMNSSTDVWHSLQNAILDAGFSIERVDIFDKQHGTFKQFVSDNTAGCDLLIHCRKVETARANILAMAAGEEIEAIRHFLKNRRAAIPKLPYLHVRREEEIDYRMLYSEFLADRLVSNGYLIDFASFRAAAAAYFKTSTEG